MNDAFQQAQLPGELRQVFAVAHFDPHGEDALVGIMRGVVHLEVGDVGAGVSDCAGDVGEQARIFLRRDFEFCREEAFALGGPGGINPFFAADDAAQRAFAAVDVDADAGDDLADDGFLWQG